MELLFPVKMVPAKRNNGQLLETPDRHRFRIRKKETKSMFAICVNKTKTKCPSTATIDIKTNQVVSIRNEHNHDTSLTDGSIDESRKEVLKNALTNPTVSPFSFADLTAKVSNTTHGVPALPTSRNFARQLQRSRQHHEDCPPVPKTLAELEVPPHLQETASGQKFLILDEVVGPVKNRGKILGFCSPTGLDLLHRASMWSVDGTFSICSNTQFYQVWIILVKTQTSASVPVGFFTLPNKQCDSYRLVLTTLQKMGVDGPEKLYLDYEAAAIKVIISIVSCFTSSF